MRRLYQLTATFLVGQSQRGRGCGKRGIVLHLLSVIALSACLALIQGLGGPMAEAGIAVELSNADITINGAQAGDYSGRSLAKGDVNGDGYEDIIIGASDADPGGRWNAGQVFVVFSSSTLSGTVELSTNADITINGINELDFCGNSVAAGDVNGDGYDDIIIGAYWADPGGLEDAGQGYVIFGSAALSGTIELSTDADVTMNGTNIWDLVGSSVATGDVNGDGKGDILIGAPLADQTYVVLGGSALSSIIELSTDANIIINGIGGRFGSSVTSGDVNGDGIEDLLIGAPLASPGYRYNAGQSYVVFGSPTLSGTIELSTNADLTINGINIDDWSGSSLVSGDVNGDGYDDIIIGAPYADPGGRSDAGQSYVVFGSVALSGTVELSTDADLTIHGINMYNYSGESVATGDVNNDGYDDIIIGAPGAQAGGREWAGQGYVLFGSASLSGIKELSTDADITINGIIIGDESGNSVAAGDINGDGIEDIIIGAFLASPGGRQQAGQTYVVLGFPLDVDITPNASCYSPGAQISLRTTITNHSSQIQRLKIVLTLRNPTKDKVWRKASSTLNFPAKKTSSFTSSLNLPAGAISGTYTTEAALFDPDTLKTLARDEATFTSPCSP